MTRDDLRGLKPGASIVHACTGRLYVYEGWIERGGGYVSPCVELRGAVRWVEDLVVDEDVFLDEYRILSTVVL